MIRSLLILLTIIIAPLHAVNTGVLNVFTDLPTSVIKVDGLIVGQESIIRLPLQVGEHYVQVELDQQLVYAETVTISNNRSTTVVSEHFVDIITKTPSRGAIDRESARIRKSRGNFAFGYTFKSLLQDAISIKWWTYDRIGFQSLVGGGFSGSNHRGLVGVRAFVSPADKIYEDDVLSGAIFAGFGTYSSTNSTNENISQGYTEFGIVIEAFVGKIVKDFMFNRYRYGLATTGKATYTKDTDNDGTESESYEYEESYTDTIRDLLIVILTNIGHTSFEVSLVQLPGEDYETTFSTGIHFYF